jgi:hypothetical protein
MDRATPDGGSNDPAMDSDLRDCVERVVGGFDPYAGAFDRSGTPPEDH